MDYDSMPMDEVNTTSGSLKTAGLWERHVMAVEDVTRRLNRVTAALNAADVPYAVVGGQAVALWVAKRDRDAVRITKDVDILLRREDLPAARRAMRSTGMDYFEVVGVGMFLERDDPHPRRGVHLIWAGEKVRPHYALPAPTIDQRQTIDRDISVVQLEQLIRMKLVSYRDQDRVHLRDMIEVGLIDRDLLSGMPPELAERFEVLLGEAGR